MMPGPATRAGPGGTSAVMTVEVSSASARSDAAQRRCAAAIAFAFAGSGTANELDVNCLQRFADKLGVAVLGDHRGDLDVGLGRRARDHHELTVPAGDNARMGAAQPAHEIGRFDG